MRAAEADWNERLRRYSELQARVSRAQRAVDQARMELVSEARRLDERSTELGAKVAAVDGHRKALAGTQDLLAQLDQQQARREAITFELLEIGDRSAGVRHEMERVKAEGQAVKERLELLTGAGEAVCPVCNQPLSDEHRARVIAQLSAERDQLGERYRASLSESKALTGRKAALEAEDRELRAA